MTEFEQKLQAAQNGDLEAQCWVAYRYLFGQDGAPADAALAMEWYVKAAKGGHAAAQTYVGYCYEKGLNGMPQSAEIAYEWYGKAAEQHYGEAIANLEKLITAQFEKAAEGDAAAQWFAGKVCLTLNNLLEAAEWFGKSAGQGYARSQFTMAALHLEGKGVKRDSALARQWLQKAADQGYLPAKDELRKYNQKMRGEGFWKR